MTMTIAVGRRFRSLSARDSDDDEDTRVYVRPEPDAWDRMMVVRMMRELEPLCGGPAPRAIIRKLPSPAPKTPNVFLTPALPSDPAPPWAAQESLEDTVSKRARVVRRRSRLPWLVCAMTFAIGLGVISDPVVRRETSSQIQSSAIRLCRFVSRIRT